MTKPATQRNPTIESLKDRIARDPLSRAFLQLAEEYRKEGRYQEAIDVCLDGLQRHPAYHTARISLGRTYLEAGDLENARRTFVEVLDLQPENHLAAKLLLKSRRRWGIRQARPPPIAPSWATTRPTGRSGSSPGWSDRWRPRLPDPPSSSGFQPGAWRRDGSQAADRGPPRRCAGRSPGRRLPGRSGPAKCAPCGRPGAAAVHPGRRRSPPGSAPPCDIPRPAEERPATGDRGRCDPSGTRLPDCAGWPVSSSPKRLCPLR